MTASASASGSPRLDFLPDVLEEHLDELQVLLAMRDGVLRASDARLRHLKETDARILAHLDGVLSVGERGHPLLRELLAGEDPAAVEVACFALMTLGTGAATSMVIEAWDRSEGSLLLGIASAIRRIGEPATLAHVAAADTGGTLRQAAAARAIVWHGAWRPSPTLVLPFLRDGNPPVRREGWLLVRDAELVLDAKTYGAALRDDDPSVRDAALFAAAWTGVQGALNVARAGASRPSAENPLPLQLLAVLGEKADASAITSLVRHEALGALRFELAGLCGFPSLVPELLTAMSGQDPRSAIAAGKAFARITGVDVTSTERAYFPREGDDPNDEFAAEFMDEGLLPDAGEAREVWGRVGVALEEMQRACSGRDFSTPPVWTDLQDLDLETRWWQLLRGRFWQSIILSMAEFERFPTR